jgi:alanine racemase
MRAWAEVDLSSVRQNLDTIQSHIGPNCGIMAVVKADAYGHGIEPIVKTCDLWGVRSFAVIGIDEALRVRSQSQRDVLVMGYVTPDELAEAIRLGLILSVWEPSYAEHVHEIARGLGVPAHVHLKIETGLNRLGMSPDDAVKLLSRSDFPFLQIEGLFTHLANSADHDSVLGQFSRFEHVIRSKGEPLEAHLLKSHALAHFKEGNLDYVRVGLAVYGFEEVIPGLRQAMSVKSVIVQRKRIKKGEGVSYAHIFRAPKDMDIAVVAMGYAEGLSLSMSERIEVLVNGHRAKQIGRICMNLCMIDVEGIPAQHGDEVVILGHQGNETIMASDIAAHTSLRQHEIVTRLGKSLPKRYIPDGSTALPKNAVEVR